MSSSSSQIHRSIPTEDRLSALPDSILCQILTRLPTKHSAVTSSISKRWKPLWLSVLDLDFDGQTFKDYITFRHAVCSVMLSRGIALPIRSFRLKCRIGYDPNDINLFINAALQRGIESLDLDMLHRNKDQIKLTSSIFISKTLTILKLKNIVLNEHYQVNIPLLKILHLDNVILKNHTHVVKFLLGCPILEDLKTNNVGVQYLEKIDVESRKIQCLTNLVRASFSDDLFIPFFMVYWVKILSIQLLNRKMLDLFLNETRPFYKGLTFHILTQMELFFNFRKSEGLCEKWRWMLLMLQRCPKLQHLTIHEGMENGNYEENWQDPQIVPECLSSQLRTCLFNNCRGGKCELQFVEYVMQNSKVLRTMTIQSASSIDLNAKHQMLRKLSVCPRGCKLIFD